MAGRPAKPEGAPVAPYAHLSDEDKNAVLEALRRCPTLSAAVRATLGEARIPGVLAAARNDVLGFGARVEHARETFRNSIREEIYRRGVTGIERPLSHKGELTGDSIVEYSDEMLKVAARLALPEYLDKKQASDIHLHGAISIEDTPGSWTITDDEAMALPPEMKAKLADVLKFIIKSRRELAREQGAFEALTDASNVEDAEFAEVTADPYDVEALAEVFAK